MNLSLPNILSILRIVLSPLFLFLFISDDSILINLSLLIFTIAALSDYFDGWFARKYNKSTSLGKFLDPLADKILVQTALGAFVALSIIPFWMLLIVLLRDIYVTTLRIIASNSGYNMKTSSSAKIKTFFQMAFVILVLILIFFSNNSIISVSITDSSNYSAGIKYLMLILTTFTAWTAIEYSLANKAVLISLLTFKFKSRKN